ncbi:MAG TPA: RDD family protein [Candidatus Binatia bacterium]
MKCQNCDAPALISDERCQSCGAKLLHSRVVLGVPKAGEFTLISEEPESELDEAVETGDEDFPARAEAPPKIHDVPAPSEPMAELRWGGLFRRAGAFLVDIIIIVLLSTVMGVMAYIGYKVGLTAHNRMISWNNAAPLVSFLTLASMGLTTTYFVVFHGMDGKTIGKWLFGLRVVGAGLTPISYRRALLRWIGAVGLGVASFGLAFLWVLGQREKRGWHDFLARTWVVRE